MHSKYSHRLFGSLDTAGKKSSAVLAEMRRLLGSSGMDQILFRELWVQLLPEYAQAILVSAESTPLTEMAEMTDNIAERFRLQSSGGSVSAVTADTSQPRDTGNSDLRAEVAPLREVVQKLSHDDTKSSPLYQSTTALYCRIHRKYGDQARDCF